MAKMIQCKDVTFAHIERLMYDEYRLVAQVREEQGGYINLFDKDWVFILLPDTVNITNLVYKFPDGPWLIADTYALTLFKHNIADNDQHIHIRTTCPPASPDDEPTNEILWGVSSYIIFVPKEERDD